MAARAMLVGVALAVSCGSRSDLDLSQDPFVQQREQMVARQLAGRDITDARVLAAIRKVPRHTFVPAALRDEAYRDYPVPIGNGQTISQPYIVAYMTQALELKPSHTV